MTFQRVLNNGGADPLTNRGRRSSIPRPFHSFGNLRGDLVTTRGSALNAVGFYPRGDFQLHMLWFPTSNNRAHSSCSIVQVNTGGRLELHAICYRLPTMRPSPGHRSRTLDLVPTGGLSRSGGNLPKGGEFAQT